jgi:hypothetical protein
MPSPPGERAAETDSRTPARDWDRLAPWIVAGVLTVLALLHVVRHGGDFFTYWRAAQRFLAGAPQYPASDGLGTYRYSPGVLLLLAPFTLVSVAAGRTIWFLLVVLSGAWVARRLVRGLPSPLPGTAVLVGFLGVSRPFLDEFFYGQADWLVLALLVAALTAEDRRRDLLSGALVALAGGLKLAPFLLAVDFALRRRWRALGGVALGVLALLAAPLLTYGLAGTVAVHREWIASLSTSAAGMVGGDLNQGVFGIVARAAGALGVPGAVATAIALTAATAVVLAALSAAWPEPRRALLLFALALASPLGWTWNFLTAWPALSLLAASGRRARLAVGILGAALLACIYDVVGPRIEDAVFRWSLPGLGFLVLFVLLRAAGRWPGSTSRPPRCSPPAGCDAARSGRSP